MLQVLAPVPLPSHPNPIPAQTCSSDSLTEVRGWGALTAKCTGDLREKSPVELDEGLMTSEDAACVRCSIPQPKQRGLMCRANDLPVRSPESRAGFRPPPSRLTLASLGARPKAKLLNPELAVQCPVRALLHERSAQDMDVPLLRRCALNPKP